MQTTKNSAIERLKNGSRFWQEGASLTVRVLRNPDTIRRFFYFLSRGVGRVDRVLRLKLIETHNMREIKSLLRRHEPITFVSSYARSGNTWMRYLLSDVLLQNAGYDTSTKLKVHPDAIIPDFYRSRVAARDLTVPTPGVLIKIHDSFGELTHRFWAGSQADSSFQKCRHLYLFRSPEDALVSFYQYHVREDFWLDKSVRDAKPYEVDAFCRGALPGWIDHVSGYLDAASNGVPIYFTSYEQLLNGTKEVLGDVLKWIGVPHTQAMLERAALNMQFTKLKATDARDIGHHGRSGAGSTHLQPATIDYIRENTRDLITRLNRKANFSPPAHSASKVESNESPAVMAFADSRAA